MTSDFTSPSELAVALHDPRPRRLPLGPFPSATSALKFAACAGIGAVVAAFTTPFAWLPFLGGGFLLGAYAPDGRGLDERAVAATRFGWRRLRPPGAAERVVRGRAARLGRTSAAGVRAGGIPIAFLPPEKARRVFGEYVRLLGAADGGTLLVTRLDPARITELPPPRALGAGERDARDGYAELTRLLVRGRSRRRVEVFLLAPSSGPGAIARLEARATTWLQTLAALGADATRLRDGELDRALAAVGWTRT